MAADLKVSGRMTVKRLKENFKNDFGGTLRVYDGREKADDNATLASIRRNEDAKGGELVCNGHLTVGSFERRMRDIFGIKVQVATPDDWTLALDGITLAKLKDIPEKCSKADMESLVAYKRKAKNVESVEADSTGVNDSIELKDIAKDAVVFLSFTANEGEEYYCYLHNLIKDGALYSVGENYGGFSCPDYDVYDVEDLDCYSENIEDEYEDVESMAEQLVKDFVEARWDECEQDNGAMAIDDEYTITIFVGDNKVYEQTVCKSVESGNGWTDFDEKESEDDDVWANFRHLTAEEIERLNGKNIEVYIGPTNPEDDEDDYEYDSLDYSFADGEVSCGGGLVTCNLADIKIYDFSKDEDLKDKFDRLFDDDERFALNLVLNLINKHIEDEDFFSITNAVVDDLPIYKINMKDDDYNPIVEDCSPKVSMGYFQSVI